MGGEVRKRRQAVVRHLSERHLAPTSQRLVKVTEVTHGIRLAQQESAEQVRSPFILLPFHFLCVSSQTH